MGLVLLRIVCCLDGVIPGQKSARKGCQLRGGGCCAGPKAEVGGCDASAAAQGGRSRVSAPGEMRVTSLSGEM